MPVTDCGGADLYYERRGEGPPLLFCNGSGTTVESARPLIAMFAARFDVLAFDYRGMGASAPVTAPYTMADLAADVAGLLDAVGWQRIPLVGISFGGMVAQEFAVTHPERVERLALIATSPGGSFASYPLHTLAELPDSERRTRGLQLTDRRWTPEWLASHPADAALAAAFAPQTPDTGEDFTGRQRQLQARSSHDVLARLPRISCPVFVGSGRYDGIAPVTNGRAIAERVPHAQMHVYEGGHGFLVQDPAAWPELAEFLSGDSAGPG